MKYAPLGSVIHGTLRSEDLLHVFSGTLRTLLEGEFTNGHDPLALAICNDADKLLAKPVMDDIEAEEVIGDLIGALDEFAPPYCYFGASEGDAADFGFWVSWDSIEDDARCGSILKVKPGQWPFDYEKAARAVGWNTGWQGVPGEALVLLGDDTISNVYADSWQHACQISGIQPDNDIPCDYVFEEHDFGVGALFQASNPNQPVWSCV